MKYKPELGILFVTILWGASFAVSKLIMADITPNYYTFLRFAGAFLVLAICFHKRLRHIPKQTLQAGVLIGLAIACGYVLQTMGLNYTTASKAGFLAGLYVVLVPVMESFLCKCLPRYNMILGVCLATAGLALLSLERDFTIGFGDLLVFVGAVFFAVSMVLISRFASKHDPMVLAIIQIGVTAIFSLVLAVFTEPGLSAVQFTPALLGLVLFAILFGTAVNTAVQNWAQGYLTATTAALIFVLEPVFGGVFGWLLVGDVIGMKQISGSALIISGMLVTLLLKPGQRPQSKTDHEVQLSGRS
ncbi:DMT family transporter [Desulfitobacterium chlororespirans]|uniref:Permease of the drug/metabolite transporter (DMT) superfamily n=1 Tax=Desulfitobacterium chlororespirans DSM 11544 TaxID=1121395 RepID=A0A1M7SF34_9FIRM|nr:DMT family transporter [Desulfitobacterium chlororespirans]SHN57105.1 Permease of the drug/metabolite transporter (DMT) superfamily [Desulfitobacterium chlororespirans DSM 11544]